MKIFLDTADLKEIRRAADAGLIDGVTTNPTLLARAAEGRDAKAIFKDIAEIVDGPVSAEVVGMDADTMISEGLRLAALHSNIVIKVPLTEDGLKACRRFREDLTLRPVRIGHLTSFSVQDLRSIPGLFTDPFQHGDHFHHLGSVVGPGVGVCIGIGPDDGNSFQCGPVQGKEVLLVLQKDKRLS